VQLPLERLRHHIDGYNRLADDSNWNRFTSLHWKELNPSLLTEGRRTRSVFVTYVEDHLRILLGIPVPLSHRDRLHGPSLHNRELFHFTVRWGLKRIAMPRRWRFTSTMPDRTRPGPPRGKTDPGKPQVLQHRLFPARSGLHLHPAPGEGHPALLSEPLPGVKEPVLNRLLIYLTKDESRHFGFFSEMVDSFVESYGEKVLSLIEEVALNYKMPLHNTMEDYRRRAILMAREAPGYDRMLPQKVLMRQLKRLGERLPDLSEKIDDSISRMMDALRITTIEGVA
jgi:hypothetical protein